MEETLYPHFYKVEKEHWWFVARQRIILNFLRLHLPLSKETRVLDVGCGTGAILDAFSRRYTAFGQDVAPQAIDFCRKRGLTNLFLGKLGSYPQDERFDLITLLDVVEHVEDDLGMLNEAHGLLRGNGYALVTVPAFPALWGPHDIATHHKRRYTKSTLRGVLASAGFQVQYLTYFNTLLFPVALVKRFLARFLGSSEMSDLEIPSRPLNTLLRKTFEIESGIVPRLSLPFGLSLLCLAKRNSP